MKTSKTLTVSMIISVLALAISTISLVLALR
jgi:hypothetical protein